MLYRNNTDCVGRPQNATGSSSSCCDLKQSTSARNSCATGNRQQQQQSSSSVTADLCTWGPGQGGSDQTMAFSSMSDHEPDQRACEQHQPMDGSFVAISCYEPSRDDQRGLKRANDILGSANHATKSMLLLNPNSINICSANKQQHQHQHQQQQKSLTPHQAGAQKRWVNSLLRQTTTTQQSCTSRQPAETSHCQISQKCCSVKTDCSGAELSQAVVQQRVVAPSGQGDEGSGDQPNGNCQTDHETEPLNYRPILAKILNEKKLALLGSPEVLRFISNSTNKGHLQTSTQNAHERMDM